MVAPVIPFVTGAVARKTVNISVSPSLSSNVTDTVVCT